MSRSRRSPAARVALRPLTASTYEIVRRADGVAVGEVECRADELAEGGLTFESVEIEAGQRGWGYGSEAVQLLEAEGKAERFLARVDVTNGLGLYFWLRLGYRPVRPDEAPASPRLGIISMVRVAEPRT